MGSQTTAPGDWTQHNGRSNSSSEYHQIVVAVASLIRGSTGTIFTGNWPMNVAGLIVAQLAHKHGLEPAYRRVRAEEALRDVREALRHVPRGGRAWSEWHRKYGAKAWKALAAVPEENTEESEP